MNYYSFTEYQYNTYVVGIQHYLTDQSIINSNTILQLQRQSNNTVDTNAVQVCMIRERVKHEDTRFSTGSVPIGHLPGTLVANLASLIDYSILSIDCIYNADDSRHNTYVIPITLIIRPSQGYYHTINRLDNAVKHSLYEILSLCRQPRVIRYDPTQCNSYHVRNFYTITSYVLRHYTHLFDSDEISIINTMLTSLSMECLILLCRLVQRKSAIRWFALDTLNYTDCGNVSDNVNKLLNISLTTNSTFECLISSSTDKSIEYRTLYNELFNYITVTQLKQLIDKFGMKMKLDSSLSAVELKECVLRYMYKQRILSGILMIDDINIKSKFDQICGQWIKLNNKLVTLLLRVQRLFFIHIEHNDDRAAPVNPMLMHDLGICRYYHILTNATATSCAHSLFGDRNTYIAYDVALSLLIRIQESAMNDDYNAVFQLLDITYVRFIAELQQPSSTASWKYCSYCLLLDSNSTTLMRTCSCTIDTTDQHKHEYTEDKFDITTFQPYNATIEPITWQTRYRAVELYAGCLHYTTAVLERHKRYHQCNTIYRELLSLPYYQHKRGYWWNRLILNLTEHLHEYHTAYQLCTIALQDKLVRTGDLIELQQRSIRLYKHKLGNNSMGDIPQQLNTVAASFTSKRRRSGSDLSTTELHRSDSSIVLDSGIHVSYIRGRPVNNEIGIKSRLYGYDNDICNVEQLCIQYYSQQPNGAYNGIHCENTLLNSLHGLLMWHCIFNTSIQNVFVNSYQDRPLDYHTDWYYINRKHIINTRIQQLHACDLSIELHNMWYNYGVRCVGVNWLAYTLEQLIEYTLCIGNDILCNILHTISQSPYDWSGGLPDLFCWRVHDSNNTIKSDINTDIVTTQPTETIKIESAGIQSPLHSPDQLPSPQPMSPPDTNTIPLDDDDEISIISSTIVEKIKSVPLIKKRRPTGKRSLKQRALSIDSSTIQLPNKPPFHSSPVLSPTHAPVPVPVPSYPQYINLYGTCKMIEVKGSRDRLSYQQCAWLQQLLECGMIVELAHVTVDNHKLAVMDHD